FSRDWSSDVCSSDRAQVGATRLDPVDRLTEVVHTVTGDQVLLLRGRLLVEDVEDVEEELELSDRELACVLGANVERVVRRAGLRSEERRVGQDGRSG